MAEHKGFDPSAKKTREARKKGLLPRSALLSQAISYLLIFISVFSGLKILWSKTGQMIEYCLSMPEERLIGCSQILMSETLFFVFASLLPASVVATLVEVLQVRLEFCWEPLAPRMERLNPVSGFSRVLQGFKKIGVIILKLALIVCLIRSLLIDSLGHFSAFISDISGRQALGFISGLRYLIYLNAVLLLFFACADLYFNRRRFLREQSMSLDEVRREMKEEEGDPVLKSHRKFLHEAMLMQEIVKRVRASKVIIID